MYTCIVVHVHGHACCLRYNTSCVYHVLYKKQGAYIVNTLWMYGVGVLWCVRVSWVFTAILCPLCLSLPPPLSPQWPKSHLPMNTINPVPSFLLSPYCVHTTNHREHSSTFPLFEDGRESMERYNVYTSFLPFGFHHINKPSTAKIWKTLKGPTCEFCVHEVSIVCLCVLWPFEFGQCSYVCCWCNFQFALSV